MDFETAVTSNLNNILELYGTTVPAMRGCEFLSSKISSSPVF